MYSVDIDTGGTMTDALVSGASSTASDAHPSGPLAIKVETTPHDVTVSFLACLESAASELGFDSLTTFLDDVAVIRWSSTITSNVLAQRTGPKLGLVVSTGHEDDLYAKDAKDLEHVVPTLVRREHVASLAADATDDEIVRVVKKLFDRGIRRVSVSLEGAFPDGAREQRILRVIGEQFPDHFLGSIPALAGSDMLMRPNDASRTFFALMNAYVHGSLASSLFRAEDKVKIEHRWKGDILVGHLNGGVARIGKTKAVDTLESGPLFGTHACARIAAASGADKVLAIDVGGTTAKASAVDAGRPVMLPRATFFGIPVETAFPLLRSVALGGGSVARVDGGAVVLGPESMGAAPGPACYGLGGTSATLTDALVVLGVVSPTAFLGGRRKLDVSLAEKAVQENVATPLGVSLLDAARRIERKAALMIAELGREAMVEAGWPKDAPVSLYAYGGNGPLFITDVARELGASEVRLFALGSILSAYGSAVSDVLHVYERALVGSDRAREAASAAASLEEQARRDLRGEGFDADRATYAWEIVGADGARASATGSAEEAVRRLGAGASSVLLRLSASTPALPEGGQFELPDRGASPGEPARSTRGDRAVYEHASLRGKTVTGPCVVDGGTFTWNIASGWSLAVDGRGDAIAKLSEQRGGRP